MQPKRTPPSTNAVVYKNNIRIPIFTKKQGGRRTTLLFAWYKIKKDYFLIL